MAFLRLRKEAIGLNVFLKEETIEFRYAIMEKRGKELLLSKCLDKGGFDDLKSLKDHPGVNLVISGKGVVHRQQEDGNQTYDKVKIAVQQNADGSFHLIRKDKLNEILELLSRVNIFPKNIYLGDSLADPYERMGLLYVDSNDQITFGESQYSASLKNALAASITPFLPNETISLSLEDDKLKAHENILYKHKFFQGLKLAGLVAFLIFVSGLTYYSILSVRQNRLQGRLIENRPEILELRQLEREFESKQRLLGQNNWVKTTRASFYIDQIALKIPEGVELDSWSVFTDKPNGMAIEGSARESTEFNKWVMVLKEARFINEKSISFEYDEITHLNENMGMFTLTFDIDG